MVSAARSSADCSRREAPQLQGEQRGQGDQQQADAELGADRLAGVPAEREAHHQGDDARGDHLAAPARQAAGQQGGEGQEGTDEQVGRGQLDGGHHDDDQIGKQPAEAGAGHPVTDRPPPGNLQHARLLPPLAG
jgi:hypothetical protein